jgi:hypothetical protein
MRANGERIWTDLTGVHAVRCRDARGDGQDAWVLSAMPERLLTEDQARSAVVLAGIYARNPPPGDAVWPLVRELREKLGLPVDVPPPASGRWGAEVWAPYAQPPARRDGGTPAPVRPDRTGDVTIEYTCGSESDPANPYGQCVLTVHADGRLTLDNRARGQARSWTGTVDPGVVERLIPLLDDA